MKLKIQLALCFLIYLVSSSCVYTKNLRILGFAYQGDIVTVKNGIDTLLILKLESMPDSNKICFFTRELDIKFKEKQLTLSILISSGDTKVNVLDTSVIVAKSDKKPFISLLNPHDNIGGRRGLFAGDLKNSY